MGYGFVNGRGSRDINLRLGIGRMGINGRIMWIKGEISENVDLMLYGVDGMLMRDG